MKSYCNYYAVHPRTHHDNIQYSGFKNKRNSIYLWIRTKIDIDN